MDSRAAVYQEPRRGLRAHFRKHHAQPRFEARTSFAARIEAPGMAHGFDAPQRDRMRSGEDLRLLRTRLRHWRETIHGENLVGGCAEAWRENLGGDPRRKSSRRAWSGDRGRSVDQERLSRRREVQARRRRLRRDSYRGALAALRTRKPAHRPSFASAPGLKHQWRV